MASVGTAYLHIMPETKGIKGELTKAVSGGATSAGKEGGTKLIGALKGVIAGAGIAAFFKKAMSAGGDLEQSFGGLETIYGSAAKGMKQLSFQAAQAGLDANTYAEQAVSFGAALKQAYGGDTVKAAKAADTAILDMADNAAKMGTDMSAIQNAYQGFAKQNYTMLDNLKLGYGGTQSEMKRLLSDAKELTGVEYDINNLGDVYDAIHAIQTDLGITGVAAKEGAETFKGSFNAMKSSATNLLASMALGENIRGPLKSLATNTKNFIVGNVLPMIGNVMKSVPSILGEGLKLGLKSIPNMVESAKGFLNNFTEAISSGGAGEVLSKMASSAKTIGGYFMNAFKNTDWAGLGKSVLTLLATGIKTFGPILKDGLKAVGAKAVDWFKGVDWPAAGKNAIQLIGNGIGTLGNWLGTGIKSLASKAADFFSNTNWSEAGSKAVEFIGNGIKSFGSFLLEGIKGIASSAAEKFKNGDTDWSAVGESVIRLITSGLRSLGSFLWGIITKIGTTALNKFKSIDWAGVGSSVIRFITSGLRSLGSMLWNVMTNVGETALEKIKGIDWAGVGTSIINFIVSGITSIGSTIGTWVQAFGNAAVGKFLEIDWVGLGSDLIDGIVTGILNFGEKIGETLKSAGKAAYKFFTGEDWEGAGEEVDTKVSAGMEGKKSVVGTAAQGVVSVAKAALENGVAEAGIVGGNTGSNYASGVGSKTGEAEEAASSLRSSVDTGMGDSGDAYTWGSDFGQNLANGIKAKAQEVAIAVATLTLLLTQLKFSVPKWGPLKHQDQWGGHFVDNFANGIKKNTYKVKDAATGMANAAIVNPSPYNLAYATPYGGGTASGSNVVMNISVSGADNPDIWARQFMRASKQYSRIS